MFITTGIINLLLNFDITIEQISQKYQQKSAYNNFDSNMKCIGDTNDTLVLYEQICLGCYDEFQDWKLIPNSKKVVIGKRFLSDKLFYKDVLYSNNFVEDKICNNAILFKKQI